MSLLKSSATIGFYTLISRLLGFVRDMVIAAFIGASVLSDAFFVAFKIPNFMRRLFAEGAFNIAFVPIYAGLLTEDDKRAPKIFASNALSLLVLILLVICVLSIAFMPWLIVVLAPGFSDDPEKFAITVTLTQITMPYILFISVVSLLGGILNSLGKFAAVAATPIIMNICFIFVPLAIYRFTPTFAHALAVSVFVAGVAQMLWLIWFCRKIGALPTLKKPEITENIRQLFKLIAPAALGAGVVQINLFIDLIIASTIDKGVSYLYYADRVNELPLALIGIAIGTVLLPMLSKHYKKGEFEAAIASQNRALEGALFLSLPAALALMVLAEPIIITLFQRGEFRYSDTQATAPALIAFAAGLPAFVLTKVLSPAFFATRDTKTPVLIACVCVFVNLVLNLALIGPFAHVGMAIATTIAGWLNVALMGTTLYRRDMLKLSQKLLLHVPRMLVATLLMGAVLWLLLPYAIPYWEMGIIPKALALGVLIVVGLTVYFGCALLIKAVHVHEFRRLFKRG